MKILRNTCNVNLSLVQVSSSKTPSYPACKMPTSEDAYHQLEFLVGNDILQPAEESVGDDEEVSGGPVAAEDVLGQVCILASVDNEESLLCDVEPIMEGICPLLYSTKQYSINFLTFSNFTLSLLG